MGKYRFKRFLLLQNCCHAAVSFPIVKTENFTNECIGLHSVTEEVICLNTQKLFYANFVNNIVKRQVP
jgi:hypothetical protein